MSVYSHGDRDRDGRDDRAKKGDEQDVGKKLEKGIADAGKAVGKLFKGLGDSLGGAEKKWEKKGGGQKLGSTSEGRPSEGARPSSRGQPPPAGQAAAVAEPRAPHAPRADAAALAAAAEARAAKQQPAKMSAARRHAAQASAASSTGAQPSSSQPPASTPPPSSASGGFDPTRAQFTSLAAPRSVHDVEAAVSAEARAAAEKEERWQAGGAGQTAVDPSSIEQLEAMGFARESAAHALAAANGSLEGAVELLSEEAAGGSAHGGVARGGEGGAVHAAAAPSPPPPPLQPAPVAAAAQQPSAEDATAAVSVLTAAAPGSAAVAAGLALLQRVLGNLAANPSEPKYRRIRRTNAKIGEMLAASPAFERALLACGFAPDASGEFLDYPAPGEGDAQGALRAQVVRETLEALGAGSVGADGPVPAPSPSGAAPAPSPPRAPPPEPRSAAVWQLDGSTLAAAATFDVPDDFFEMEPSEAKALLASSAKQREERRALRTRAQREADAASRRREYKRALVRVRFPDGYALQGTFGAAEPVSALFEFVAGSLREPWHEFHLTRPAGSVERGRSPRLEAMTESIAAAELTPSSVLSFQLADGGGGSGAPYLTAELLSAAKPLGASQPREGGALAESS